MFRDLKLLLYVVVRKKQLFGLLNGWWGGVAYRWWGELPREQGSRVGGECFVQNISANRLRGHSCKFELLKELD